jgi:hypothetical protein
MQVDHPTRWFFPFAGFCGLMGTLLWLHARRAYEKEHFIQRINEGW